MSEHFWQFNIICPKCKSIMNSADGFETDDWTEAFAFSGWSEKSDRFGRKPVFECPKCNGKTDIEFLFKNKCIEVQDIDGVKEYLERMLDYYIQDGYLGDHGWEPDLEAVVNRYSALFPDDKELAKIKRDYLDAIYNKKSFFTFEPAAFTTQIGPEMIRRKSLLQKVYLPKGLKSIESETFKGCYRLEDVFVPDSVQKIGNGTFESSGLRTVHLPQKIHIINPAVFKNCNHLTKVFLSDDIKTIGESAFEGCSNLKSPWMPNGLTTIGARAFYGCTEIKEIWIPESVVSIGEDAFGGCPNLIIKGKADSIAAQYAKDNNILFVCA